MSFVPLHVNSLNIPLMFYNPTHQVIIQVSHLFPLFPSQSHVTCLTNETDALSGRDAILLREKRLGPSGRDPAAIRTTKRCLLVTGFHGI
jgi:glutamyl/glutaminyl-tRNA synthetase